MKTKLAFGVGASAEAAIYIAFSQFSLLFYNTVHGLPASLCGIAVFVAMCFDGISDPLVGSISDRWSSRLGRRHPFLYAAPIPVGLCFAALFMPPPGLSGTLLFLWFMVFTVLMRLALTLYHVPHLALGAELSADYRERSVVMAYNAIFGMVGGSLTFFLAWNWFEGFEGGSKVAGGYFGLGAGVGAFAAIVIMLSAFFTRDQIPKLARPLPGQRVFDLKEFVSDLLECLKNPNYRTLVVGLVFLSAATGTRDTINAYMGLFYWGLPEAKMKFFATASVFAFIVAFFLTPWLNTRFGKREAMIVSVAFVVIASLTPVTGRMLGVMPENGAPNLFPILYGFVALYWLSTPILQISVMSALADVADEHELLTGRRQEGMFYSARTLFGKLSIGLGHIIAGAAIDLIGFPANAKPGEVAGDVIFRLGIIDGPVAAVPAIVGALFYAHYRIDRKRHAEIQRQLIARGVDSAESAATTADVPAGAA